MVAFCASFEPRIVIMMSDELKGMGNSREVLLVTHLKKQGQQISANRFRHDGSEKKPFYAKNSCRSVPNYLFSVLVVWARQRSSLLARSRSFRMDL